MKKDLDLCKEMLKQEAIRAASIFKNDRPALRQAINDYAYYLSCDYNLSDYDYDHLSDYACKLHNTRLMLRCSV